MTVHNYSLNRGDILRTQLHMLSRNRVLIGFIVIASTFTALLDLRQPGMAAHPLAAKVLFVIFFDIVFIAITGVVGLIPLGLMIVMRKHRGVLGEHTLEVTDAGLVERTDVNETIHRWQGFSQAGKDAPVSLFVCHRYQHSPGADAFVFVRAGS